MRVRTQRTTKTGSSTSNEEDRVPGALPRGQNLAALVELDAGERRVLGRRHPEVAGYGSAVVVVSAPECKEQIEAAIRSIVDAVTRHQAVTVEKVIEELLGSFDAAQAVLFEEARRQSLVRERVLHDYQTYTGRQVAALAGSTANQPTKLAARWRKSGRIFAVPFAGKSVYLAFQFDDSGRPLPVIAAVLRQFVDWGDWDKAVWFVSDNAMLNGRRPAEVLEIRPADVVEAASLNARIRPSRSTPRQDRNGSG